MINREKYLITSALPYANGPLHIGHLAGAYLNADIYVRFLRLMGKKALFVCGSDEHGAAITMRAKKEGVAPQEIIDKYHSQFRENFQKLGVSFDIFHRTSSKLHHETSQGFFRTLYEKGIFKVRDSEQYYDEEAKQFLADRYIRGTCPHCDYEDAYGDQCEQCGSSLSPTELRNPQSTLSGNEPILKKTRHFYLPLNEDEEWLREFIENGTLEGEKHHDPEDWKTHVLGQCKSWLDQGLKERAMTRDLNWGVDVPKEIPDSEGKKLYVWMDAPIGYISASKQWTKDENGDWEEWWKDEETALIHFIGKDNIVFHCIIFPAILKAHGDYNLPVNVPANQFMNLESRKISTSRNWAVWIEEYLQDFPERIDELRYSLCRNMPETKDSEFTWKGFQDHANNELVNNLANFVNRVVVLTQKYFDGKVPEFDPDEMIISAENKEQQSFHDNELLYLFDQIQEVCAHLRKYRFREALKATMAISATGNQLLQFNEPWKAIKNNEEEVKVVLNLAIQYLRALSLCTRPFMPDCAERIAALLNVQDFEDRGELNKALETLAENEALIPAGHHINEAKHLFDRFPDEEIESQIEKLNATDSETKNDNTSDGDMNKNEISFEDFTKLDIKVGTILAAEDIPKANKLLKLTVDLGGEERTVVSGISKHYQPSELPGKQVPILVNLAPRKIMGIESQGMILMVENTDGALSMISPEREVDPGSSIS